MEIKKLIAYAAAFSGALGLASNLYAADPAKERALADYAINNGKHTYFPKGNDWYSENHE